MRQMTVRDENCLIVAVAAEPADAEVIARVSQMRHAIQRALERLEHETGAPLDSVIAAQCRAARGRVTRPPSRRPPWRARRSRTEQPTRRVDFEGPSLGRREGDRLAEAVGEAPDIAALDAEPRKADATLQELLARPANVPGPRKTAPRGARHACRGASAPSGSSRSERATGWS